MADANVAGDMPRHDMADNGSSAVGASSCQGLDSGKVVQLSAEGSDTCVAFGETARILGAPPDQCHGESHGFGLAQAMSGTTPGVTVNFSESQGATAHSPPSGGAIAAPTGTAGEKQQHYQDSIQPEPASARTVGASVRLSKHFAAPAHHGAASAPVAAQPDGQRKRGSGSSDRRRCEKLDENRGDDGGATKVDIEWENTIAKNILSLYQTKLKVDLDEQRSAKEEELGVSLDKHAALVDRCELHRDRKYSRVGGVGLWR